MTSGSAPELVASAAEVSSRKGKVSRRLRIQPARAPSPTTSRPAPARKLRRVVMRVSAKLSGHHRLAPVMRLIEG